MDLGSPLLHRCHHQRILGDDLIVEELCNLVCAQA
jgi:hypothetical protein